MHYDSNDLDSDNNNNKKPEMKTNQLNYGSSLI